MVEARDLLNKDLFGGKSNPFVVLKLWGQERVSHVIKNCLSPKWNQTFMLYVFFYEILIFNIRFINFVILLIGKPL